MKVCVVGSGGREHALAQALARSADVVVTPGNPGMAGVAPSGYRVSVTEIPPESVEADLFVIGPERPLVDGLADRLRADHRQVFGPGADGARLEGSKAYMKDLLVQAGVPTARHGSFDDLEAAKAFLRELPGPWVVKTDGLASGKGVLVTESMAEAEADVVAKLSGERFGAAGRRVVIEEGLAGVECSLLVVCDGTRVAPLALAQDAKRVAEGDEGPNTGGMGAFSPVPAVDDHMVDRIMDEAIEPTLGALRRRGVEYRGVLYAGLMVDADGPVVLEFNVRFGDPETQVVLPRLDEDLTGLLAEAAAGRLRSEARFVPDAAVCVVLASAGYPESPRLGDTIDGVDDAGLLPGVTVFHAGTRREHDGRLVSAGGRVLGVTALAPSLGEARARAYDGVAKIHFEGMHYRADIAAGASRSSDFDAIEARR
ncbi:MAG TPA: phosphoribosylamine--glycine ligase [Acidimicrobiales bacterium]|nr:phosphoribosylamine--glycine ligase [Acidimicrobiales bacterium]